MGFAGAGTAVPEVDVERVELDDAIDIVGCRRRAFSLVLSISGEWVLAMTTTGLQPFHGRSRLVDGKGKRRVDCH